MRLGPVGGGEHDFIAGVDHGHYWNDGFVEIIARRAPTAALDFDPGGVGADHKRLALCH